MVISVVVGALGAIADRLPGWLVQILGTINEAPEERPSRNDASPTACSQTRRAM